MPNRREQLGFFGSAFPSGLVLLISACIPGPPTISDIQGTEQYSTFAASRASVEGVVTAVLPGEGFFIESETPDNNRKTSEGILVIGDTATVGDRVAVSGVVVEVQRNPRELPLTVISVTPAPAGASAGVADDVQHLASNVSLPPPAHLPGPVPHHLEEVIAFWESLEGMRVHIESARVTGPSNRFGESAILIDDAPLPDDLATLNPRGAAVLLETRYLPPRILLDDALVELPPFEVGDRIGAFVAIVDYRFGEYRLYPLAPPTDITPSELERERAEPSTDSSELAVATFNVENLDLGDDPKRFQELAVAIVEHLASPDLIALQEMQDDSGPLDDGVVSSEDTHRRLISAIAAVGGPAYAFREVRPSNNEDGGEPWGNIRTSFLLRTDSAIRFVDRPGGDPSTTAAVIDSSRPLSVTPSLGRIDPSNQAFENSRKPLVGTFSIGRAGVGSKRLFVINVHLSSKGGDDPAYGITQPPVRHSEGPRNRQTKVIADFVRDLLSKDRDAAVIVLGDFNDFYFSDALANLEAVGMVNLVRELPPAERYSYIFRGQGQALDHILVSPVLAGTNGSRSEPTLDIVHLSIEFPSNDRISDHDPLLARFSIR